MVSKVLDRIVSGFDKHMVCLAYRDASANPPEFYSHSAFLVSMNGEWMVVTAGHNIESIDNALAAGRELDAWHIDDSIGRERDGNHPVPFHFDRAHVVAVNSDAYGWDYALLVLDWLTVQQLKVYGAIPLDEEAWQNPPDPGDADFLFLCGFPEALIEEPTKHAQFKTYIGMSLDWLSERPPEFKETEYPRIFASIAEPMDTMGERLTDIVGMSGGPVMAIQRQSDGSQRYWVIGVLSAQIKSAKKVAICPLKPLLNGIKSAVVSANGAPGSSDFA